MRWYVKKFSEFFDEWRKGELYLKNGQSYMGTVEEFTVDGDFKESKIEFKYEKGEKAIPLKDIKHFRVLNGPILNIEKYLNIIELAKQSEEQKEESDEKGLVCVAFGLEFYTSKKVANLLKSNVKDILFTGLKNLPLLMIKDQPAVDMTPTFTSSIKKLKSILGVRPRHPHLPGTINS
ncbi:MAG: hypothetical protein QMD66_01665 [Actinomycetota bacterium]|nr:hypothetical protein [Actinomycetota bacterium]MDI6821575.1 hypothetical protein [Actinomycetota bacterium]